MQYVRQQITYTATSPAEVIAATEPTNARIREIRWRWRSRPSCQGPDPRELPQHRRVRPHAYGIYARRARCTSTRSPDHPGGGGGCAGLARPSSFDPVTEEGRPLALSGATGSSARCMSSARSRGGARRRPGLRRSRSPATGRRTAASRRWWPIGASSRLLRPVVERAGRLRQGHRRAQRRLRSGGYTIITSMNVDVQDSAKRNVETEIPTGSSDARCARDRARHGRVQALAANRTYDNDDSGNPVHRPGQGSAGHQGDLPEDHQPAAHRRWRRLRARAVRRTRFSR